jgi:flagellin
MPLSVNTNSSALAALQNLNSTNNDLAAVQQRINTGLRVSSAKEDSSAFVIAQNLRSDLNGFKAVTSSLNRAKSVADVTLAGAQQVSDLMNQMRAKALEASDAGIDQPSRLALNLDFKALQEQVATVIKSSDFNGTNLLDGDSDGDGDLATGTPSSLKALQSIKGTATLDVSNLNIQFMMVQDGGDKAATPAVTNQIDLLKIQDTPGTDMTAVTTATITLANANTANAADISTKQNADDVLRALTKATTAMSDKLNTLGSAARKIDSQLIFTSKLSDTITSGIGTLVDADLSKESANLQALQLKQQLGVQALSIANQTPQAIASLFR